MVIKTALFTILALHAACESSMEGRHPIPAAKLVFDYAKSQRSVRDRYDGRELEVKGYVIMTPDIPSDGSGEGLIVIGEGRSVNPVRINCRFTRREFEPFRAVVQGQAVTVKGVFNGERGPELRFCRLVIVEPGRERT